MRYRIFTAILTICLVMLAGTALAQQGSGDDYVSTPDELYDGTIVNDKDEDTYSISLAAGEGVIITAEAAPGSDLDTYLYLNDANGVEVAQNDDAVPGETLNSQIIYVAETAGNYVITMNNYPGTSGEYVLTIDYVTREQAQAASEGGVSTGGAGVEVTSDTTYTGFMSDDVSDDLYTIYLEQGQGVIISAIAAPGSELDTFIALDGPNGQQVAQNDDAVPGETLNSEIIYVAQESGDYTVTMSNYPGSSGDYELTISITSGDEAQQFAEDSGVRPTVNTTPTRSADLEFSGTIVTDDDEDLYPLSLQAGQGVIVTLSETDGLMDTFLTIRAPDGSDLISNDDRGDFQTLNSQVGFFAPESGEYTVVVSNFPGSPGDYLLEIFYADESEVNLAMQAMRVMLSGELQIYDTINFRIHYTLEGIDATTFEYVQQVGDTMEEVLAIQVNTIGWAAPPPDGVMGGDTRYDVYLTNLDSVYGYMSSSSPSGDNPNTTLSEEFARPAYLVLDNDYADFPDPTRAMRATAAHEFHHIVQYGYDYSDLQWYLESTASWMETITFPDQQEATIYVEDVFTYPELCFGAQGDADITGFAVYGTWLFMEFLQSEHGNTAPLLLWNNISQYDNWEPLERTLADFGDSIEDIVIRYHINNLMRDYAFTTEFSEDTVWLEENITGNGDWTFTGNGIQELGANYFAFDAPSGIYDISLANNDPNLEVWAVGITGNTAAAIPLGTSGTIDSSSYDHTYLVVYNRVYDENVDECSYISYDIRVQSSTNTPTSPTLDFNASQFAPLRAR